MRKNAFSLCVVCLFQSLPVFGQRIENKNMNPSPETGDTRNETVAVLEVGAVTSWNIAGGAAIFAPNLAAECTPIENWLELEAGVSPFFTGNSTEWDTDLLFKKPWSIFGKVEFMIGVGPQ